MKTLTILALALLFLIACKKSSVTPKSDLTLTIAISDPGDNQYSFNLQNYAGATTSAPSPFLSVSGIKVDSVYNVGVYAGEPMVFNFVFSGNYSNYPISTIATGKINGVTVFSTTFGESSGSNSFNIPNQ